MTYYLYHIPGKKIGVTRDLKERVEHQQGYNEDEYVVLMETCLLYTSDAADE